MLLELALLALPSLQTSPLPLPPGPAGPLQSAAGAGTPAGPGDQLQPGIPASASPEARALFESLASAMRSGLPSGSASSTPHSFDMRFEVRSNRGGTNDFSVRQRFLAPDFVRSELESGREQGRYLDAGRAHYWAREPGSPSFELAGRDYANDRQQIDELLAISANFVALVDPRALRMTRLERLAAAPAPLPTGAPLGGSAPLSLAAQLDWLELVSPDFRLQPGPATAAPGAPDGPQEPGLGPARSASAQTLFRVRIGLDRGTHQPRLALIDPLPQAAADSQTGAAQPLVLQRGALCVLLGQHASVDGWLVAQQLYVWELDLPAPSLGTPAAPPRFQTRPSTELYFVEGSGGFATPLEPADFQP